jgi:hypothetical protein
MTNWYSPCVGSLAVYGEEDVTNTAHATGAAENAAKNAIVETNSPTLVRTPSHRLHSRQAATLSMSHEPVAR